MVAILTIHGWGYWALWLWEGIYPRGLYWDAYGSNMLSGALSWGAGAALWFTSLSFIRRKYFEVRQIWLSATWLFVDAFGAQCAAVRPAQRSARRLSTLEDCLHARL